MTSTPNFNQENISHDPAQCLECMLMFKTPEKFVSSESLRIIANATSTSSLSQDAQLRPNTSDSRPSSNMSTPKKPPYGQAKEDGSTTSDKSPSREMSPHVVRKQSREVSVGVDGGEHGSSRGEDQEVRKILEEKRRGARELSSGQRRGNRSSSPLVRMKRVDSGEDKDAAGEEAERRKEESHPAIIVVGSHSSKESTDEGSQDTSEKEISSSQSSGNKGATLHVVGSQYANTTLKHLARLIYPFPVLQIMM